MKLNLNFKGMHTPDRHKCPGEGYGYFLEKHIHQMSRYGWSHTQIMHRGMFGYLMKNSSSSLISHSKSVCLRSYIKHFPQCFMQYIKHEEECFIRHPNTEKLVEKTRRSWVFLNNFDVFGYLMKHTFECLKWLLKWSIILGEIQG